MRIGAQKKIHKLAQKLAKKLAKKPVKELGLKTGANNRVNDRIGLVKLSGGDENKGGMAQMTSTTAATLAERVREKSVHFSDQNASNTKRIEHFQDAAVPGKASDIAHAGQELLEHVAPADLPIRFQAAPKAAPHHASGADAGPMEVELDRERVVMSRTVANGLPIRLSLQIAAYEGVGARIETGPKAADTKVQLELIHADPALTLPLSQGADFQALSEDWRRWSELFALPMMLIEADGSITRAPTTAAKPEAAIAKERRHHPQIMGRRGRFQRRRKCGRAGSLEGPIVGREIIARR